MSSTQEESNNHYYCVVEQIVHIFKLNRHLNFSIVHSTALRHRVNAIVHRKLTTSNPRLHFMNPT